MDAVLTPAQKIKARMDEIAKIQAEIELERVNAVSELRSAIQDKVVELNNLILDFNNVSVGSQFKQVTLVEGGTAGVKTMARGTGAGAAARVFAKGPLRAG